MQVSGVVVPAPGVPVPVDWLTVQAVLPRGQAAPTTPLAIATTDAIGRFRMVVDDTTPQQTLTFAVLRDGRALPATSASERTRTGVKVTVTLQPAGDRLRIATLADLRAREADVVARLGRLPQGGVAFFVDPIRALGAAGVDLAPQAVGEFTTEFPHTPSSTAVAFDALLSAPAQSSTRVKLLGIFQQGSGKP